MPAGPTNGPRDFVSGFAETIRARISDPLVAGSSEARAVAALLDEMEEAYAAFLDERLTPQQAAAESGFSDRHIRLLRAQGVISDRRRDLPRRPGHGLVRGPQRVAAAGQGTAPGVAPDPAAVADQLLNARARRGRRTGT